MNDQPRLPTNAAEMLIALLIIRMDSRYPGELDEIIKVLEKGLDPDSHHPNVAWTFRPKPDIAAGMPEMADALALLKALRGPLETDGDK